MRAGPARANVVPEMDDGLSNWEMGVSAADRDHPDEARTMATTPARTAGDKWSHAWMTDLSSGFSGRPWAAGCGGTAIGITPLVQHLVQPPRSLVVSAVLSALRTRRSPLPKLDVEGSSPFARSCRVAAKPRIVLLFRGFAGRSQSIPV